MNPDQPPQQLLRRITTNPLFRDSAPHATLLEYLCYQTQAGQSLHEHDIGVEVFGFQPGYDTDENAAVRRTTEEIRDRLKQYFSTEGRKDRLRMVIPKGEFRVYFYEADPAQVASADEPTGMDCFWAPHWESDSTTLLLHGELPGEAMPIGEAYAVTMIAMLFHKQDRRLEMHPAGAVQDTPLAERNLVLVGTAETNPIVARFSVNPAESAVAERLAPNDEHGWVTILTAPSAEAVLDAARYVVTPETLDKTLAQYGDGGFPPFFRLTIRPA